MAGMPAVEQWRSLVAGFLVGREWAVPWVMGIIHVESGGAESAIGAAGEVGLMQVRPELHGQTAAALLDPKTNLRTGIGFFEQNVSAMYSYFGGPVGIGPDTAIFHKAVTWGIEAYNRGLTGAKNLYKAGISPFYYPKVKAAAAAYVPVGEKLAVGPPETEAPAPSPGPSPAPSPGPKPDDDEWPEVPRWAWLLVGAGLLAIVL